ncbi:ATR-interacting protein [Lampris incognitus]|uniref:ATR-interacting protein n=1 Tax=Lampris incognitus TaxID=2546036 RepID=UPI0024B62025|nr:ATR-interacting protein [Lampris incognitus]
MDCPPTKRLKFQNKEAEAAFDDPFGDEQDFTQDDLAEIDVIASQAVSEDTSTRSKPAPAGTTSTPAFGGSAFMGPGDLNKVFPLDQVGGQQWGSNRDDYYSLLEAQCTQLKLKLKEVENEMLVKNGEVRMLRDSLKGVQQQDEERRQAELQVEQQRQQEQSKKEKELKRKVQSLQSELHFKEAEINEMRTKLHSSEKSNKTPVTSVLRNSPRLLSSVGQSHHGRGGSSSTTGGGFVTKETFSAHLSSGTLPVKPSGSAQLRDDGVASSSKPTDRQAVLPDIFLPFAQPRAHLGCVLLSLLLQQPLSPSTLGLHHLLSVSPNNLRTPRGLYVGSSSSPGKMVQNDRTRTSISRTTFSLIQTQALTGLNILSQSRNPPAARATRSKFCPGAVHLLPLLDHHLTQLCQALHALSPAISGANIPSAPGGCHGISPPGDGSVLGFSCSSLACGGLEEAGFSLEEAGLAALRVLSLLLAYSDEVVQQVLSVWSHSEELQSGTELPGSKTTGPPGGGLHSQHAVGQHLLQLCDPLFCSGCGRKEVLVQTALKTLCVLLERTPHTHSVLWSRAVCVCLSVDSNVQTVMECVSVLLCVSDKEPLDVNLCSQHETCVFLRLFHFIRTRPDPQATHTQWISMDLQVVRLLSRLLTQRRQTWSSYVHANCQCYTELVQTVVVILHRQWLELRDPLTTALTGQESGAPAAQPWCFGPGLNVLRESLVLLHWLQVNHSSFSDCCRPVFHMYDQLIPAVKDTLRNIPDMSEGEELALDDVCRSEADDTEDMDTDGS